MFRKSIIYGLIFSFAVLLSASIAVSAEDVANPEQSGAGGRIYIEDALDVPKGAQVEVDVRVSGVSNPGILSYQIQLQFDTSVVEIVEIRAGDSPFGAPNVTGSVQDANRTGSISFGQFINGPNGMTNGKLAGIVLRAIGDDGERSVLRLSLAGNSCQCVAVEDGLFTIEDNDLDDDGIPDDEEDDDRDGLDNATEEEIGTNPDNPDTDNDGALDGVEVEIICVDPLRPDTDGDGLADGEELDGGTDPCDSDTDDDGIRDGADECPYTMEDGQLPNPDDGCASAEVGGDPPLWGNVQVFPTPESAAGLDLNNNNSQRDTVLRYKDLSTGETINTTEIVQGGHANIDIYENIIVYMSTGNAIKYFDVNTGTAHSTGQTGTHPAIYGDNIVFEKAGSIAIFNISSGEARITSALGTDPVIHRNLVAFHGGSPNTIQTMDVNTGVARDTGAVGQHAAIVGNIIAFATSELHASRDLDGDGSLNAVNVIRYLNTTTGQVTNTGAIGDYPVMSNGQIAFSTKESHVDEDLNGDGYERGEVIQYFDIASSTLYNTGELGTEPDIYNGQISFYYWENWVGEDLNGDRDTNDPIIGLVSTAGASARTTTPTASMPSNSSSRSFRNVMEFDLDGNSFIDDGEFFDAIDGWVTGSISNDLFFEIVDAWISGASVSSAAAVTENIKLNLQSNARTMAFDLTGLNATSMKLEVFSLNGERVAVKSTSSSKLVWNMRDASGQPLANGVYFYVLSAESANNTWNSGVKKIAVVR